jgi:hypothetical protein
MRTAPDQPNVYCSHSHASIYERRRRRCPVCGRRPGDARLPHSASARAPLHVSCGVCTDTRSTPCLGRCLHGCPAGGRSGPGQCSILHSLWGTIHIQYPRPSRPPLQTMYPGPAATPDRSGSQKKKCRFLYALPLCSFTTSRWLQGRAPKHGKHARSAEVGCERARERRSTVPHDQVVACCVHAARRAATLTRCGWLQPPRCPGARRKIAGAAARVKRG